MRSQLKIHQRKPLASRWDAQPQLIQTFPISKWRCSGNLISNGPAGRLRQRDQSLNRVAGGFCNFANYRTRILSSLESLVSLNWNVSPTPTMIDEESNKAPLIGLEASSDSPQHKREHQSLM